MQNNISKEYVKTRLLAKTSQSNISHFLLPVRLTARELLIADKNFIMRFIISSLYEFRDTLRSMPFLYKIIVKVKNKMLAKATDSIFLNDLFDYPYDTFIQLLYERLLNREAEPSATKHFRAKMLNGASNKAIAYMIIKSDEFDSRKTIYNFSSIALDYRKYRIKQIIFKIPVVGRFCKVMLFTTQLDYILARIDYVEAELNKDNR